MNEVTISRAEAERVAAALFEAVGVPREESRITAEYLVLADLRGVKTHGLVRLPIYIDRIRSEYIEALATPEIVTESGSSAVVDGKHGLGPVNAEYAMRLAIRKAQENGVGAVTVRNSNHFGAAAGYATLAADSGCLGVATTNAAPLMPPVGGSERRVGNNPLAIAAPSGNGFPIVLDIAMSAVAAWNIRMAAERGDKIPPDWAFDKNGEPTTDPIAAYDEGGLLRPVGDHKGLGLAIMMDVLSGVLSGGGFGTQVKRLDQEGHLNTAHFFLALDVEHFIEGRDFFARISALSEEIYSTSTREGVERVLLPGEKEDRVRIEQTESGITYEGQIYDPLIELIQELDVEPPRTAATLNMEAD